MLIPATCRSQRVCSSLRSARRASTEQLRRESWPRMSHRLGSGESGRTRGRDGGSASWERFLLTARRRRAVKKFLNRHAVPVVKTLLANLLWIGRHVAERSAAVRALVIAHRTTIAKITTAATKHQNSHSPNIESRGAKPRRALRHALHVQSASHRVRWSLSRWASRLGSVGGP